MSEAIRRDRKRFEAYLIAYLRRVISFTYYTCAVAVKNEKYLITLPKHELTIAIIMNNIMNASSDYGHKPITLVVIALLVMMLVDGSTTTVTFDASTTLRSSSMKKTKRAIIVSLASNANLGSASPENKTLMQPQGTQNMSTTTNFTNIVLVHGAWADGSSWSKEILRS